MQFANEQVVARLGLVGQVDQQLINGTATTPFEDVDANQVAPDRANAARDRTERPWQGQMEDTPDEALPQYDPKCYLCPGNSRAGGAHNPPYTSTFAFDNDFAALKPDTGTGRYEEQGLLIAEAEPGIQTGPLSGP